jgi:hypothetical protein
MVEVGIERAKKHLLSYDFPSQFLEDVTIVTKDVFKTLSNPETAGNEEALYPLMMRGLSQQYAAGYRTLASQGETVEYNIKSKPKLRVTGFHFTYGPYPAPPKYVAQNWVNIITLVIPEEDSMFISQPHQKRLMKKAQDDGCYMKIDVQATMDIEFVVKDKNDIPIIRDKRDRVDLQFVSPHFTPWDEIFDLQADGTWRLRWAWRLSDIDHLLAGRAAPRKNGAKIDWFDMTWGHK